MFERLAGKLLTKFLSKYFVDQEQYGATATATGTDKASNRTTQLGVWSGYVCLENLVLRREVVNDFLKSRGLPFELQSCTLGRVEITVPWAKLGRSSRSSRGRGSKSASDHSKNPHHTTRDTSTSPSSSHQNGAPSNPADAAVVVVVDGIHILLATRYDFDDDAMEQARIAERRKTLLDSETYVQQLPNNSDSAGGESSSETAGASGGASSSSLSSGLAGFFKKRVTDGLLNDILEHLHIHLRDLHIRMEDTASNPSSPFGCGITLESLHVQSEEEDNHHHGAPMRGMGAAHAHNTMQDAAQAQVVRKLVQLNHLAVYWNELEYAACLPLPPAPEVSVLHHLHAGDDATSSMALADAMYKCIPRRSGGVSPVKGLLLPVGPAHSYLLLPVDGTCHASLSKYPSQFEQMTTTATTTTAGHPLPPNHHGPALIWTVQIDTVAVEVRDFQSAQVLCLAAHVKQHNHFKHYRRRYRPTVSVKEDPRAWWLYAFHAIQLELEERQMRWSWNRFQRVFGMRRRYCELYERHIRRTSTTTTTATTAVTPKQSRPSLSHSASDFNLLSPRSRGMQRTSSMINLRSRRPMSPPSSPPSTDPTNNNDNTDPYSTPLSIEETTMTTPSDSSPSRFETESRQRLRGVITPPRTNSGVALRSPPRSPGMHRSTSEITLITSNNAIPEDTTSASGVDGAGRAAAALFWPLTNEELVEMQSIEDGILGDVQVRDIVLFRMLVHAKIAADAIGGYGATAGSGTNGKKKPNKKKASFVSGFIKGMISEDYEAGQEYERLMAYLDNASKPDESAAAAAATSSSATSVAVFFQTILESGSVSFYYPRHGGLHDDQLMNVSLQDRFVEFDFQHVNMRYTLFSNYDSFAVHLSLLDFQGVEIRSNQERHVLISRSKLEANPDQETETTPGQYGIDTTPGFTTRARHQVTNITPPIIGHSSMTPITQNRTPVIGNLSATPIARNNITPMLGNMSSTPITRNTTTGKKSETHTVSQLLSFNAFWKSPQNPECELTLSAKVEQLDCFFQPDGEWPQKLKRLFKTTHSTINAKDFWEDLNMAYINSWDSARIGLQAKAELALFKHRNVDFDIQIDCPVLHIKDRNDTTLTVDLGNAHFVTKKLAGVASGKLSHGAPRKSDISTPMVHQTDSVDSYQLGSNSFNLASNSFNLASGGSFRLGDEGALNAMAPDFDDGLSRSPTMFASQRKYLDFGSNGSRGGGDNASTTSSISSLGGSKRKQSVSLFGNERGASIVEGGNLPGTKKRRQQYLATDLLDVCFYDAFELKLCAITVDVSHSLTGAKYDVLKSMDIEISIEKSVIPKDHTISRLKADCVVNSITLNISQTNLIHIGNIVRSWSVDLKSGAVKTDLGASESAAFDSSTPSIRSMINSRMEEQKSIEISHATSDIDEFEFLDALDDDEADYEDSSGWFEDDWIADAESVYDVEARPSGHSPKRRNRQRSVSDVSSRSDRSFRSARRSDTDRSRSHRKSFANDGVYLNADNLARLDEGGAEEALSRGDDDESELSQMSDADSFHSAMSLGGQAALVDALFIDIQKAEEEIEKMKSERADIIEKNKLRWVKGQRVTTDEQTLQQIRRERLRLELSRAEAELRALHATHQEMLSELEYEYKLDRGSSFLLSSESSREGSKGEGMLEDDVGIQAQHITTLESSMRARALLKARAQRSATRKEPDVLHSLTSGLNRDLFYGTLWFSNICIVLSGEDEVRKTEKKEETVIGELCLAQTGITVHHRTFDTRIYTIVEHVHLSNHLPLSTKHCIFEGGRKARISETSLAAEFPHLVSVNFANDKFLRFATELRRRNKASTEHKHSTNGIKTRLIFGGMDISPDEATLLRFATFGLVVKEVIKSCKEEDSMQSNKSNGTDVFILNRVNELLMGDPSLHKQMISSRKLPDDAFTTIDASVKVDSIRFRLLDPKRKSVGAIITTGMTVRFGRALVAAAYGSRGQLDLRCSNFQLLDIYEEGDSNKAREVIGRSDNSRPLFLTRMRTQLVPQEESRGWVIDSGPSLNIDSSVNIDQEAWNVHVGAKGQALSIAVKASVIDKIVGQAKSTISCISSHLATNKQSRTFSPMRSDSFNSRMHADSFDSRMYADSFDSDHRDTIIPEAIESNHNLHGDDIDVHDLFPLRWRVDLIMHRTSATVSSVESPTSLCIRSSTHFLLQPDPDDIGSIACFGSMKDLSIIRTSDEWPLLEPLSISWKISLRCANMVHSLSTLPVLLQLSPLSPWSFSDAATALISDQIDDFFSSISVDEQDITRNVSIASSPIRINVSSQICCLVLDLINDLKNRGKSRDAPKVLRETKRDQNSAQVLRCGIASFDVKIVRETKGGIVYASPLILFAAKDLTSCVQSCYNDASLSFKLTNIAVYDISTYPGVRVLGNELISRSSATISRTTNTHRDANINVGKYPLLSDCALDFALALVKGTSMSVELMLGNLQFMAVPSFFRSLFEVQASIKTQRDCSQEDSPENKSDDQKKEKDILQKLSLPLDIKSLKLELSSSGFELQLPLREVSSYLRSRSIDPISVVALRGKGNILAEFSVFPHLTNLYSILPSEPIKNSDAGSGANNSDAAKVWRSFLDQHGADGPLQKALTSRIILQMKNIQVIHTNVKRSSVAELIAASIDSTSCCFIVAPPPEGEQQIASPFNLEIAHHLAGGSFEFTSPSLSSDSLSANIDTATRDESERRVSISKMSHSIGVDIGFVNILLYIEQSTGVMNDVMLITIRPIIDVLSRKHEKTIPGTKHLAKSSVNQTELFSSGTPNYFGSDSRDSNAIPDTSDLFTRPTPSLHKLLEHSTTSIMSIHGDGVLVTCVPGGATRLTESPIVKCTASQINIGLTLLPVPQTIEVASPRSAHWGDLKDSLNIASRPWMLKGDADVGTSRTSMSHSELGTWFECELSAHYHNTRLVVWEPVIEPWVINVRAGLDLTEILKLPSTIWMDWYLKETYLPRTTSMDNLNERAGGKMRDIRRLLRSTLVPENLIDDQGGESGTVGVRLISDVCQALLHVMHPSSIDLGVYRPFCGTLTLPGYTHTSWLRRYGFPDREEIKELKPAMSLIIRADKPLLINITGALIESVMGFASSSAMLQLDKSEKKPLAPHWIRNNTGRTVRFREVLEVERVKRGETSKMIVLSNSCEIPLSLKRGVSQTCDPHRAFIEIEFDASEYPSNSSDGSKAQSFFSFKAEGKIPVDMVGVYTYPLVRLDTQLFVWTEGLLNDSRRNKFGSVTVRVALYGGTKIVSIESPLMLKNISNIPICCELKSLRDHSIIWKSALVPSSATGKTGKGDTALGPISCTPVPVDLVDLTSIGKFALSVNAIPVDEYAGLQVEQRDQMKRMNAVKISCPPSFSDRSTKRGLIKETEISLETLPVKDIGSPFNPALPFVHFNVCSSRIGDISRETRARNSPGEYRSRPIPEQRLLLFRPPFAVKNYLPFTIVAQARVRVFSTAFQRLAITEEVRDWEDIGSICCGDTQTWAGATSSDDVEIRVRLVIDDKGGDYATHFLSWSTSIVVPSEDKLSRRVTSLTERMVLVDQDGSQLALSGSLEERDAVVHTDSTPYEDIRAFGRSLSGASRVLGIFVPFWVVNGTGHDLEFKADRNIAGQRDQRSNERGLKHAGAWQQVGHAKDRVRNRDEASQNRGLADLFSDEGFAHLKARQNFDIFLIGDDQSSKLRIRRRTKGALKGDMTSVFVSSWSDAITLRSGKKPQKVTVFSPPSNDKQLKPRALVSRIIPAPRRFGGRHGTKLVHIANQYVIINSLGRQIEVSSGQSKNKSLTVGIEGGSIPFHCNDAGKVRFRLKEFGWEWSGPFALNKKRRDVCLRLRNKLTSMTMIAVVEFHISTQAPGCLLVFKEARPPPFRLENHSLTPLQFGQSMGLRGASAEFGSRLGKREGLLDTTLLPYHNADYAWDYPDSRSRSILIEIPGFSSYSDSLNEDEGPFLGRFDLDRIAPGTDLKLSNTNFIGRVVADGPTRVLRISDASLPQLVEDDAGRQRDSSIFTNMESSFQVPHVIEIKLREGIGISIVDWTPQELLYVLAEDILVERRVAHGRENVSLSIGCISADNQLWVSPYPVLMKIGRRLQNSQKDSALVGKRRKRRHNAMIMSLSRDLDSGGNDGLALIHDFDISMDPINLKVDAELFEFLWKMIREVQRTRKMVNEIQGTQEDMSNAYDTRDVILCNLLDVDRRDLDFHRVSGGKSSTSLNLLNEDLDLDRTLVTAVMAAKMLLSSLGERGGPITSSKGSKKKSKQSLDAPEPRSDPISAKPSRKYYMESVKISRMTAQISWTGALPSAIISLPDWMRPALTFEGLPVMLRPYSGVHSYGTVEDHMENFKSHYLSIWRILDVFVGLSFKPSFIIKAFIFTWRESVAEKFERVSGACAATADQLLMIGSSKADRPSSIVTTSHAFESTSTTDDDFPIEFSAVYIFCRSIYGKAFNLVGSALRGYANMNLLISSTLRYDGGSTRYDKASGAIDSMRMRAPRLFATQDGKDLLVEYVEGENAGKALLSRVRFGMYLGEGYMYHGEGAQLRSSSGRDTSFHSRMKPLIFLLTSKRLLFLDSGGNLTLPPVVWELSLEHIVLVEFKVRPVDVATDDSKPGDHYDVIYFWYLIHGGNNRSTDQQPTSGIGSSTCGFDSLNCKSVYFSSGHVQTIVDKISGVNSSETPLLESRSEE